MTNLILKESYYKGLTYEKSDHFLTLVLMVIYFPYAVCTQKLHN